MILYEYPFNERIRTYLRIEHLFRRMVELVSREHPLDHHFALATIFEVMDVGARADLKSDLLKDLEKHRQTLGTFRGNPAISEQALDAVLAQVEQCYNALSSVPGKPGHALTDNEWLMGIRSRIGIPGGTCEFDLPAYYAWQQQPGALRRADLHRWAATLAPLAESVRLLLKMLRQSGAAQKMIAPAGQYQQNLPQGKSFQLLRLSLDPTLGIIPEISGNRLMVSIRFMRQQAGHHLHASADDCAFELTLCA